MTEYTSQEALQALSAAPVHAVGVYGATGYTGQVLIEILQKHPNARLAFATSEHHKQTEDGLPLVTMAGAPLDSAEAVFLCLPNGVSGGVAAQAVEKGVRVIDLSADLRLDTPDLYSMWYKVPHPAPGLLPAPYGLPEINREELRGAKYVANPGCHVTATLLALYPLAKAGALDGSPIIADTKTGVTGAGREPKLDSLFAEVYGDVKPYNIGRKHRHVPEIEQALHKLQPDAGTLVFAPHLVPVDVGLLATVYVRLRAGWDLPRVRAAFAAAYDGEPLVALHPAGRVARFRDVAYQNHATVGISEAGESAGDLFIITCAIDNLRKGASSQAVQNFNLMMGLPETAGLL